MQNGVWHSIILLIYTSSVSFTYTGLTKAVIHRKCQNRRDFWYRKSQRNQNEWSDNSISRHISSRMSQNGRPEATQNYLVWGFRAFMATHSFRTLDSYFFLEKKKNLKDSERPTVAPRKHVNLLAIWNCNSNLVFRWVNVADAVRP